MFFLHSFLKISAGKSIKSDFKERWTEKYDCAQVVEGAITKNKYK